MQFVVVLAAPEHPNNVGFCARALRANGLTDLRIVWPRRKQISPKSYITAHGAADILDSAQIFSSLSEALHDTQAAIAFSRRYHDSPVPHTSLPYITQLWQPHHQRVALVFGRESHGLSTAELNLCTWQCEIPMAPQRSLNLGQALSVVLYEIARAQKLSLDQQKPQNTPATANFAEIESLVSFVQRHLSHKNRDPAENEVVVRQWLQRLQPNSKELRALFGILRDLTQTPARTEKSG